jgi:hypothetical protein
VDQAALDAAVAEFVRSTYTDARLLLKRAEEITSTGTFTAADVALVFQSQAASLMHQAHIETVRNYMGRAVPTKPESP